jgi:hypothetical protein
MEAEGLVDRAAETGAYLLDGPDGLLTKIPRGDRVAD